MSANTKTGQLTRTNIPSNARRNNVNEQLMNFILADFRESSWRRVSEGLSERLPRGADQALYDSNDTSLSITSTPMLEIA